MPRVVCVIIITLACLGVAFIIVLVVCAYDGFATWKRWRKLSSAFKELDAAVIASKKQAEDRERHISNHVACANQVPFPPCDHRDCPRKADSR